MRRIAAIGLVAALGMAMMPADAAPEKHSARYTSGAGFAGLRNAPNPQGAVHDTVGPFGLMGYQFAGIPGKKGVMVKVVDDVFGAESLGVLVCSPTCTDSQQGGCTDENGELRLLGLQDGAEVNVGIMTYSPGGIFTGDGTCENIATTGIVTLTYR